MAECGKRVGGGLVTFSCTVEGENHDGPCMAVENDRSVADRRRWESGAAARATLAEFQGPAQTTAERYTEGAAPLPGSGGGVVERPTAPAFRRGPEEGESAESVDESPVETSGKNCPFCHGTGEIDLVPDAFSVAYGTKQSCGECGGSGIELPRAVPTEQRPGDQPLPTVSDRPFVQHVVIADIERRIELGRVPIFNRTGELVAEALVDEGDLQRVLDRAPWHLTGKGYVHASWNAQGEDVYLHRFVLGLDHNDLELVGHINGNKLDCRKTNLRAVTPGENAQNTHSRAGSSSRFRGVSWDKAREKWVAQHTLDGQHYYLGRYDSEEEAALAALRWRRQNMPFAVEDRTVMEFVRADVIQRMEIGKQRYGTPLQTFNGRDGLLDAFEEALDLAIYLRQVVLERAEARKALDCIEVFVQDEYVRGLPEGKSVELMGALGTLRAVLGT